MQQEITFTIMIDAQEMQVRYRLRYFSDYGHFEFRSPHEPPRRIPVSETGYRSHFAPMWEIEAAPSVEEYARAVALILINAKSCPDDDSEEEAEQLALF